MNLVECSRCHSVLIAEEFSVHPCKIPIKKHVKIMAGEMLDLTNDSGKAFLIDSLDGVSYMIEFVEKGEALPWSPNENTRDRNQTGTTQNPKSGSVHSLFGLTYCKKPFGDPLNFIIQNAIVLPTN